jgi:alpha-N-arabinofuranosidase
LPWLGLRGWIFVVAHSLSIGGCSGTEGQTPVPFDARLTIAADQPGKPANTLILGTNVQWVDRGDELLDATGRAFAQPMLREVVALRPTIVRYPGGAMSDTYRWKDGVGEHSQRRIDEHFSSKKRQAIEMGTREFLELCEATGAVPMITVNTASASAEEAAEWVAYTNKTRLTSGRTGQRLPSVGLWEIGNEPYLKDENRKDLWIEPEAFARRAAQFSRAMKKVDPTIRVGIPLRSDRVGDVPLTPYPGYNEKVLRNFDAEFDYVSLHTAYMPMAYDKSYSDDELYWAAMASVAVVAEDFENTRRQLRELRGKSYPIAVTEYNALFTFGKSTDGYLATPAAAVYIGDLLRMFAETDDLLMANFWSLSGNWFFGSISNEGKHRPAYFVLKAYRQLLQGRMVPVSVATRTFETRRVGVVPTRSGLPLVSALATREGDTVRLIVMNKDPVNPGVASLILPANMAPASGSFATYGGPRRFGLDIPQNGTLREGALEQFEQGLRLELAPFSVTLVELQLAPATN